MAQYGAEIISQRVMIISKINQVNMIDPFHLQTYGKTTVNYNRDIEIFPVLKRMLERILGKSPYASPTDMGGRRNALWRQTPAQNM